MPSPNIIAIRLNHSLEDLGRIGHTDRGMQRVAFSDFDIEGRAHTMEMMRQVGLAVRIDPAGNIIGRKDGSVAGLAARTTKILRMKKLYATAIQHHAMQPGRVGLTGFRAVEGRQTQRIQALSKILQACTKPRWERRLTGGVSWPC